MPTNARDLVDAHLANSGPDPDTRPASPEPTTQSGVAPNHALYDSPQEGSQSAEFRQGRRKRRSTERGGQWIETFNRSEDIRKKGNRTRKINSARRSRERQSQGPNDNEPTLRDNDSEAPAGAQPVPDPRSGPLPERQRCGRTRTVRRISRSPTPGSTDHEIEIEATQPPLPDSQYTFVYETLDHEGLVEYAQENFGVDGRGCDTQTILAKLRVAEMQQKAKVGPPRLPPSIHPQPGRPLQVGGGWHHEFAAAQPAESRGTKRGRSAYEPSSSGSSKRHCVADPDTATESETDEWPKQNERPARVAAERIINALPGTSLNTRPTPSGTHPPPPTPANSPPSRESTPTTVPASPHSCSFNQSRVPSQYGRSVTPDSPMPPIPTLLFPAREPTHAHPRHKASKRHFDRVDRDAAPASAPFENDDAAGSARAPALAAGEDVDELVPTDEEEVPETEDASVRRFAARSAPQRTYGRTRTHQPSQSQTTLAEPNNNDEPVLRPNSPSLTPAELIRRERTRAVTAKALTQSQGFFGGRARRHNGPLFAEASAPPTTRSQPRPEPGASGLAPEARTRGTRRVDPVGAARADMIAFNDEMAQRRATTFVDDTTRESERTARRTAPESRPLSGYLEDDEESLAQAEAFAKKKWPPSSRPSKRKPKPLARDISGVMRQVLVVMKIHLFVYGLVQGMYQTRATFIRWAASVYFATWQMELPSTPYQQPSHDILEIAVNNLATLRGKVKERLRPFAARVAGFVQRLTSEQTIQDNLAKFNLIYPNSFHCKSYFPRKGHFESPDIGHCIAVALFDGPNSPGVMYPDYFLDMPLTVVAFCLAIWMFCIEEWSNGFHQNGDLGMAAMREKYESMLAELKNLRDVAPRRMERLQNGWRDFVMEYSGAQVMQTEGRPVSALYWEMRPDTPEPEGAEDQTWAKEPHAPAPAQATDSMSVDELNAQMLETARQASLRERLQAIIDREEREGLEDYADAPIDVDRADTPVDVDAESRAPTPPPVEFDSQGRLTARSKGKGRAN